MTLRPRATDLLCAALLFVAALAARIPELNGDLWLDEAWVANSVLAPTWREMFFYPPWLQTTPPLYLVATRVLTAILGDANWVFRLLSLIFGLMSVGLAVFVARRFFGESLGWLAGALVALSSSAVMFSKEGKSYSGELCVGLLLIAVIVELPAWWFAAVAAIVAFGFSYSSLTFIPGVLLAYLFARRPKDAARIAAATAVPILLLYIFYIRPNQGEDLNEMWSGFFSQGDPLRFYFAVTRSILFAHHWMPLQTIPPLRQLLLILTVCGVIAAVWRRNVPLLLATISPFLCAMALNILGLYPYGLERFSLYLYGCIVLLILAPLDLLSVRKAPLALTVTLLAATVIAAVTGNWPRRVDVGLSAAKQELRHQGAGPADLIFVAPQQWEGFIFSQRRDPVALEAMEGRFASACCPRDGRWQAGNFQDGVAEEMNTLLARGTGRRIWLLHLRLEMLNPEGRLIPETWQKAYLIRKGCRQELTREFQSSVLSAYRCPLL